MEWPFIWRIIMDPDDINAVVPRVIIVPLTGRGQPLGC